MFITSLILGIASIVLSWIPVLGTLLAIAALIISIIAMVKRSKNKAVKNGGMAIAGLVTSIFGFVVSCVVLIFIWLPIMLFAIGASSSSSSVSSTTSILDLATSSTFSEYNYKTMTGSEVKSAIKKYYNRSNFILEVQSEKDGEYLQYGKTKGSGAGTKYKSLKAATSQSDYTRKTSSSLSSTVSSSASYTARLIYGTGSEVIGISFRRDK